MKARAKLWKRRGADDHQQGNAVANHCIAFVRLVADAAIMRENDPAALTRRFQPRLVWRVRSKVIRMSFDRQAMRPENLGKGLSEVAVDEIDNPQAARS